MATSSGHSNCARRAKMLRFTKLKQMCIAAKPDRLVFLLKHNQVAVWLGTVIYVVWGISGSWPVQSFIYKNMLLWSFPDLSSGAANQQVKVSFAKYCTFTKRIGTIARSRCLSFPLVPALAWHLWFQCNFSSTVWCTAMKSDTCIHVPL